MAKTIQCPNCAQRYPFRPAMAGKQLKCRKCGHAFRIAEAPAAKPRPEELRLMDEPAAPAPPVVSPATTGPPAAPEPAAPSAWHGRSEPEAARRQGRANPVLVRIGGTFAALGILALVLPIFGVQFKWLMRAGALLPYTAGAITVLGAVLLTLGMRRDLGRALGLALPILFVFGLVYFFSPSGHGGIWTTFRCPDENFAASFPGTPKKRTADAPSGRTMYGYDAGHGVYAVFYAVIGARGLSRARQLERVRRNVRRQVGRIRSERDITLAGGHPGLAFEGTGLDGTIAEGRAYVVGDRLYVTMVMTDADGLARMQPGRFLRSFRLLEPVEPKAVAAPKPKRATRPPVRRPVTGARHKPTSTRRPSRPALVIPPDADAVTRALLELRSGSQSALRSGARRLETETVAEARRAEVAKALADALGSSTDATKPLLLRALAKWYTPECLPAVIDCTKADALSARHAAYDILSRVRDARAARAVAARLGEDGTAAQAALEAMGSSAEPAVLERLSDPDRQVRLRALRALQKIGTAKCIDQVAACFGSGDGQARFEARKALAARGPAAEDAALELLAHANRQVRLDACKLLREIGTEKSLEHLAPLIAGRDVPLRVAAAQALQEKGAAAEDAVIAFLKRADTKGRVEACNLLGRTGTKKSLTVLRALLKSKDSRLRLAAKMAGQAIIRRGS